MTRLFITMMTIAALVAAVSVQGAYAGERQGRPDGRSVADGRGGPGNDSELDRKWESMTPEERREMVRNYERWKSLPTEKRERIKKGYTRYERMSPDRKGEFRLKMERYRQYSDERKTHLKNRLRTWRDLDPEQQKQYKNTLEQFRRLPEAKRVEIKSRINAIRKLPPERQSVEREALREDLRKEGIVLPESGGGNRQPGQGQGRGNSGNPPGNWKR